MSSFLRLSKVVLCTAQYAFVSVFHIVMNQLLEVEGMRAAIDEADVIDAE